jgi:cytochrome b pre-mRNA-processing protein 3
VLKLFRKSHDPVAVEALYRAIVAQSRRPVFYAEWGVPDTVTGRFDMISFHMALLFRRLRSDDPAVKGFAQALFDHFFKDMDRELRELGAGDLGVPKKIQKMGNLFYGTMSALNRAMDRGDRAELEAVLRRNIYAGVDGANAGPLAGYAESAARALDAQPIADLLAGRAAEMAAP